MPEPETREARIQAAKAAYLKTHPQGRPDLDHLLSVADDSQLDWIIAYYGTVM